MKTILQPIGRTFLNGLAAMGRLTLFALESVRHCVTPPFYPRLILRQMIEIGYYSLPYVGMTAIFTGMVLALQTYTGFNVGAETVQERAPDRLQDGGHAEGPAEYSAQCSAEPSAGAR